MTIWHFLLLLVVAGLCGSLGRAMAGTSRGGCLGSIALGFIGALLGTWLARVLGLPGILVFSIDGQPFPVIWATLGAALFVAILGFLARPKSRSVPPR
jgi:uncharacterized membrane protein YeaQ/YmgE (transglycosylase-associated protein family)